MLEVAGSAAIENSRLHRVWLRRLVRLWCPATIGISSVAPKRLMRRAACTVFRVQPIFQRAIAQSLRRREGAVRGLYTMVLKIVIKCEQKNKQRAAQVFSGAGFVTNFGKICAIYRFLYLRTGILKCGDGLPDRSID